MVRPMYMFAIEGCNQQLAAMLYRKRLNARQIPEVLALLCVRPPAPFSVLFEVNASSIFHQQS